MAHIIRSLRQLSVYSRSLNHHSSPSPSPSHPIFITRYSQTSHFNSNSNALKPQDESDDDDDDDDSEDELKWSRNEKKRVARRAVKMGMQLSKFSTPQIKRILKVASLQQRELLDAILVAKTLSREAKRRQFSFIGKSIREADPELMDSLLCATLEGDKKNFEKLFGLGSWDITKEDEDYSDDFESEDDEQDLVERWYDGLVNKDIDITNEVYSLHDVEFDRQKLRSLVRRVHSIQDDQISSEENVEKPEAKQLLAKKALTRFLRNIVKQMPED